MTAEEELTWLRARVAEQTSELRELREHVQAALNRNFTLTGELRALASGSAKMAQRISDVLRLAGEAP